METAKLGVKHYLLKLKVIGLDSDPYNLPKHQRSTDIDNLRQSEFKFSDIHCYLILMLGKQTKPEGVQKSGHQPPIMTPINTISTDYVDSFKVIWFTV